MPIELRAWLNPQSYSNSYSTAGIAREAAYFTPAPEPVTADPDYITAEAREYEAAGYDSAIWPQSATWPDVTVTAAWALARTQRLRVVLAHRPGTQAPTAAARALATLDRVSDGRTGIHLILGSGADFDGEFYRVRGAFSGVKPVQSPRPVISLPAESDEAVELAGRHADVLAFHGISRAEAAAKIAQARQAAAGRDLGFWINLNMVVGETDDQARPARAGSRAGDPAAAGVPFGAPRGDQVHPGGPVRGPRPGRGPLGGRRPLSRPHRTLPRDPGAGRGSVDDRGRRPGLP